MIKWLKKPYVYAVTFTLILMSVNLYVLLNTFVIPHSLGVVEGSAGKEEEKAEEGGAAEEGEEEVLSTSDTYSDGNITITIDTVRQYDTTVYIADVKLASAQYLKTALAHDAYGTNIKQKTSETAEENGAILAVNGDYYGADTGGYVIKNGTVYRENMREDSDYGDLVLYGDGAADVIYEEETSAQKLIESGAQQLLAFGPVLVDGGEITVSGSNEVSKAMSSNPRTAFGWIDDLHYIFVVSDGRTQESEGLSLYELAQVMQDYGCSLAYNLDGGGSSTMYFNGKVVNNPTTNGRKIAEREVSDIVYIGYGS